jgi:tight adherence protein C
MNNESIKYLLAILWAIFAGGLAWYCCWTARQITYVTLSDGRRQERTVPFCFRLLLPFAPNFTTLFRHKLFARSRSSLSRSIISAGYEGLLSDVEMLALFILSPLVLGGAWAAFITGLGVAGSGTFIEGAVPIMCLLGFLLFLVYPFLWLRSAVRVRHNKIRRALPFVLDILTLSVEAGMDFMTALQRHVERTKIDALCEELIRVIREIQLGKTRRESLRDMSIRVNFIDLRTVVNALVQADELGVSIGSILRIQSDQIRARRFERAEKLANEAPIKMLFPLMTCIFPAVFLILLGPILNRLMEQGF